MLGQEPGSVGAGNVDGVADGRGGGGGDGGVADGGGVDGEVAGSN